MSIMIDQEEHCGAFVRLNEIWIQELFLLEESDKALAADPYKIVRDGGHILSVVENGEVVGVCALFRESDARFQLARMAVSPDARGKGHGEQLMRSAIALAKARGAQKIYLLSNTVLAPALSLYRKHGFHILSEGAHPVYARCNVVMELDLHHSA